MAESKEFTRQQLLAMHKTQLIELVESLHIKTERLTKSQLIKQITGSKESVSADNTEEDPQINVGEVFTDAAESVKVKSVELPSDTNTMTDERLKYLSLIHI